jgi:hypothetical protein
MGHLRSVSFALPLCAALVSSAAFAQNMNSGGLPPFVAAAKGVLLTITATLCAPRRLPLSVASSAVNT